MVDALPCSGGNGSWLHQQLNSRWSHWRAGPYYGRLHESPKLTSTTNHPLLIPAGPHHCSQKPHHSHQKPSVKVSQAPKPQIKFQFSRIVNCFKAALRTPSICGPHSSKIAFLRGCCVFRGAVRVPFLSSMGKLNCSKVVIFKLFKESWAFLKTDEVRVGGYSWNLVFLVQRNKGQSRTPPFLQPVAPVPSSSKHTYWMISMSVKARPSPQLPKD